MMDQWFRGRAGIQQNGEHTWNKTNFNIELCINQTFLCCLNLKLCTLPFPILFNVFLFFGLLSSFKNTWKIKKERNFVFKVSLHLIKSSIFISSILIIRLKRVSIIKRGEIYFRHTLFEGSWWWWKKIWSIRFSLFLFF